MLLRMLLKVPLSVPSKVERPSNGSLFPAVLDFLKSIQLRGSHSAMQDLISMSVFVRSQSSDLGMYILRPELRTVSITV